MKRKKHREEPLMKESLTKYHITRDERAQIKQRFKQTGGLTRKKLIEYIPAMLITNLSTLLLISVDGLVVGNLVGGKALSAVNIFSPATLLIGVISAMIASVQGSLSPLMGLMIGSKDHDGTRLLLRQGLSFVTIFVSIIVVIIELFPGMFYHFHGINDIPDGGELSLRLFAVSFLFAAFNTIFRLYYSNRKDTGFSSTLTVAGHAAIPLLAFILTRFLPGPFLWLGNLIAELIILAFNMKRYTYWLNKDIAEHDKDEKTFYLTVTPDKAVEASQMIQSFAKENGCSAGIAYRVALCMEEMVAYIEASGDGTEIDTQIIVRFLHDSAHFIIIDNGRCIVLDDNPESQELITNNYALIKKMAKSVMVNEDSKILAAYEAMQQAMIDKDIDKLGRIVKDGTTFTHVSGKTQTKEEYFGEIADGTLNYYKYKITDCKITVNGDTATLTAKRHCNSYSKRHSHRKGLRYVRLVDAACQRAF